MRPAQRRIALTLTPDISGVTGDANGDGVVNVDDLIALILNWG